MATLTKNGIIDELVTSTGLGRKEASVCLETVIEIIKNKLENGEHVSLSGFGKWSVRQKAARKGRNPQSGEEIIIQPRKVISFSLSNILREELMENV